MYNAPQTFVSTFDDEPSLLSLSDGMKLANHKQSMEATKSAVVGVANVQMEKKISSTPKQKGKKARNRGKQPNSGNNGQTTDMNKVSSNSNEGSVISTGHFRPEVLAQIAAQEESKMNPNLTEQSFFRPRNVYNSFGSRRNAPKRSFGNN